MKRRRWVIGGIILSAIALGFCLVLARRHTLRYGLASGKPPVTIPEKIVVGAKAQQGTLYDASYVMIAYPDGDVSPDRGACTDVVVRALRRAGIDLQKLIHEDMEHHWDAYPHLWGLTGPNPNIDHRRVPNQMCFFRRHGLSLTTTVSPQTLSQWQPGDFVYWNTGVKQLHTGIISDDRNAGGVPLVIDNASVCRERDCLTAWPIIGHFRYPR